MSTYQEYAKWGWPTFPVAGPVYASDKNDYKTWKAPLVDSWKPFQDRLPTPEEIAEWEKKWPLAWIGCTTGPFSNLFVIDIDGENGIKNLAALSIPMPITKVAKTKRGHHYFFKWNPKLENYVTTNAGKIREGIDIRGKGGFVILPSFHSKREWICEEFCAELPQAWYPLLAKKDALPENWRTQAIAELSIGNRHHTFVQLISSCFNAKWPVEAIMGVLRPFAIESKLGENLEALILDIQGRYYPLTIINAEPLRETRFTQMQNETRNWMAKLPPMTTLFIKLHSHAVDEMYNLQDRYDLEANHWVDHETGSWQLSKPFKTSEDILRIANEIR